MSHSKTNYQAMPLNQLSDLAQKGDLLAFNFLQVAKFNRRIRPGDKVLYKKSEIEGVVEVKTTGKARLLSGESSPVVPIESIGDVLLERIN